MALKSLDELERSVSSTDSTAVNWQIWETVRELAVGRMGDGGLDVATRLRWAELALAAVHRKSEASNSDSLRTMTEIARIRAHAIREFGVGKNGELRDPVDLCRSALLEIGESRAEVRAEASHWRTLPAEKMLRLRLIKNMLTPLQGLEALLPSRGSMHQELTGWLSLLPDLP
ncbi:hypothetical protein ACFC7A_26030 [Streptomyces niveus]|uniref:hypothetical protein n=1 Tax=Streptomyces niveus TaxID=193462 RepID=UPI0035E16F12